MRRSSLVPRLVPRFVPLVLAATLLIERDLVAQTPERHTLTEAAAS